MKPGKDPVIRLFCQYTAASIIISIMAWCAVGSGLVHISLTDSAYFDWLVAGQVYGAGATVTVLLWKKSRFSIFALGIYVAMQITALMTAWMSHQLYYLPTAGSQGTIPALAITLAFFSYFLFYADLEGRKN